MAEYLFVDLIAEKWGVSKSWVYRLLRAGRVEGAFFRDGRWSVPANAKKPDFVPAPRIRRLQTKKLTLPKALPLNFDGVKTDIAEAEKLFSDCAEYVINFVDLNPSNGAMLFAALAYPHISAKAVPESDMSYAYLHSLKHFPKELYGRLSLMLFEFFAIAAETRRDYFDSVRDKANDPAYRKNTLGYAAALMFLSITSSGSSLAFDGEGNIISYPGRKKGEPENLLGDILLLSSLLGRAELKEREESFKIPEYSALHISESQYSSGKYQEECATAERVFAI